MTQGHRRSRTAADGRSWPDRHATLGALLRRPYEHMHRWVYRELAARGYPEVRPGFSVVLRHVSATGSRTSELAALAGMAKQSMAYLVEQMAGAGLLEVVPDERDGRAKLVRLTPRGEEVVTMGVRLAAQCERSFAEAIGAERMERLRSLLGELYDQLDETAGVDPPG